MNKIDMKRFLTETLGLSEKAADAWLANRGVTAQDADEKPAGNQLLINGPIVDDTTGDIFGDYLPSLTSPGQVRTRLADIEGAVDVRINSPGGDVDAASGIYTLLRERDASIIVEGIAASAASFIMLASSDRRIAETGRVMIHRAWAIALGNANDMRATADMLEKVDGTIAALYAKAMGIKTEDALELMTAETWYSADEAVEAGLLTGLYSPGSGGADGEGEKEKPKNRAQAAMRRGRIARFNRLLHTA